MMAHYGGSQLDDSCGEVFLNYGRRQVRPLSSGPAAGPRVLCELRIVDFQSGAVSANGHRLSSVIRCAAE